MIKIGEDPKVKVLGDLLLLILVACKEIFWRQLKWGPCGDGVSWFCLQGYHCSVAHTNMWQLEHIVGGIFCYSQMIWVVDANFSRSFIVLSSSTLPLLLSTVAVP